MAGQHLFVLCGIIFPCHYPAMSFSEEIAALPVAQVVAALGCPAKTVYEWRTGRRKPPHWQQRHFLRAIREGQKGGSKGPNGIESSS